MGSPCNRSGDDLVQREYWPRRWIVSIGSGVVIGAHGEVLTNAHVVENCTKITIRSSAASAAY